MSTATTRLPACCFSRVHGTTNIQKRATGPAIMLQSFVLNMPGRAEGPLGPHVDSII